MVVIPFSIISASADWAAINPYLFIPDMVASILGTAIMLLFLYLMPNGRFSPRWAYIPLICTLLLVSVLTLKIKGLITLSDQALSLVNISTISLVLLGGSSQVYRYLRDSNAVERQQTKWILSAVVIYALSVIVWVLIFGGALAIPYGKTRLLANLGGLIFINLFALLILPATITIAILRYKLWGIDVIINRTLVYGAS